MKITTHHTWHKANKHKILWNWNDLNLLLHEGNKFRNKKNGYLITKLITQIHSFQMQYIRTKYLKKQFSSKTCKSRKQVNVSHMDIVTLLTSLHTNLNNSCLSPCHTCPGNIQGTQVGHPWECTVYHQVVYHIHSNRNVWSEMPFLRHKYTLSQRSAVNKSIPKSYYREGFHLGRISFPFQAKLFKFLTHSLVAYNLKWLINCIGMSSGI